MDYKNAGVDIEAGYKSVELMKKFPWKASKGWKSLLWFPERTAWERS